MKPVIHADTVRFVRLLQDNGIPHVLGLSGVITFYTTTDMKQAEELWAKRSDEYR